MIHTIYEEFIKTIPDDLQQMLRSKPVRREMLKKYGERAFLDPVDLKFPVINPNTGVLDCRLIYAAYFRASIFANKGGTKTNTKEYYEKIRNVAIGLYTKENCTDVLKIKLSNEDVDLLTFTQILDLSMEGPDASSIVEL